MKSEILPLVEMHEKWRTEETINLQASENIISPAVKKALGSDLAGRYSLPVNGEIHGAFVKNAYGGTRYSAEIEERTEKLARDVFGAEFSDVRPLSGHIAAMTVLAVLLERGNRIMAIDAENGGYDGYLPDYMSGMLGLSYSPLPFDNETMRVKTDELASKIRKERPAALILGSSYIPFPYDLKAVRDACADCLLLYDASHVLGLIAGGKFQPDALKYCDVVYGSTHKTFFGPQGGIILSNRWDLMEPIRKRSIWLTYDNTHMHRIAGLGVALEEMKAFGEEYADAVIKNSKTFAKELDERDIPVRLGPEYSESHQVLIDAKRMKEIGLDTASFSSRLEEQNIVVDAVGRLGTQEATRIGMKERDMETIAGFIYDIVIKKKRIKKEISKFRSIFNLKYTF